MALPAPSPSFALVNGHPVFMDEREDQYFVLDPELEREFLDLLTKGGSAALASAEIREALRLPVDDRSFAPTRCASIEQSLVDDAGRVSRPHLAEAIKLWRILHRVRKSLRKCSVQSNLAAIAADGALKQSSSGQCIVVATRRFHAARKAIPFAPHCLTDSLALLAWLGPARCDASLVFGVKLHPFAAHCWVQSGPLLLNDRSDVIERFEPVRTISCSPATL